MVWGSDFYVACIYSILYIAEVRNDYDTISYKSHITSGTHLCTIYTTTILLNENIITKNGSNLESVHTLSKLDGNTEDTYLVQI